MNRHAMTKPLRRPFGHAIAALALACAVAGTLAGCNQPAETPPLAGSAIGGPFTLVDKSGRSVQWGDFAGKWRIVYFGYTFCPDACPMDVGVFMRGYSGFAKDHPDLAAQVQPIFITIDPARDTPARVGEFAAAFGPKLLGLTGTPAQVDGAAKAFVAYYARGKDLPGGYLMDHSRVTYLMDRDGQPVAMLPVDKGPAAVTAELAKWVK